LLDGFRGAVQIQGQSVIPAPRECVGRTEPQSSKSRHSQRPAVARRRFIFRALAICSSSSVILRRASNCQRRSLRFSHVAQRHSSQSCRLAHRKPLTIDGIEPAQPKHPRAYPSGDHHKRLTMDLSTLRFSGAGSEEGHAAISLRVPPSLKLRRDR
jgi:hypothetical protein